MAPLKPTRVIAPAVFAVLVSLLAWAVLVLVRKHDVVSPVWPVTALIAAFLVRWAKDNRDTALTLVLCTAGLFAANLAAGSSASMGLLMVGLNLIQCSITAWVIRRVGAPVDSLKGFAVFMAGPVLIVPLALGAVLAASQPGMPFMPALMRWFCADGLGIAIFGSFALTIGAAPALHRPAHWRWFALGQVVVAVGAAAILFGTDKPPLFVLGPLLVIGALSHAAYGGVTAILITTLLALAAAFTGHGTAAVAELASVGRLQLTQVLLASMVVTVLPITILLRRLDFYAAELEERRARAEELSGVKTRLLAHVSHEIRSPLSGVTGLAELLREGALGELTPAQRETLAQIVHTGAEVDQLARDLTDATAIEAGKATVHIVEVGVAEALRSALAIARFRMSQHEAHVEVSQDISEDLCVAADPLRLRQILVNLLVNAAKYGGRPPRVQLSAAETGLGSVRFEVCDNGPGISPERRAGLFKEFERLGAERSEIDGAGIGLSLSHSIARLQNGALGFEEGDAGGSRFWLELPLWSKAAAA